jgi:hypothetical protein
LAAHTGFAHWLRTLASHWLRVGFKLASHWFRSGRITGSAGITLVSQGSQAFQPSLNSQASRWLLTCFASFAGFAGFASFAGFTLVFAGIALASQCLQASHAPQATRLN